MSAPYSWSAHELYSPLSQFSVCQIPSIFWHSPFPSVLRNHRLRSCQIAQLVRLPDVKSSTAAASFNSGRCIGIVNPSQNMVAYICTHNRHKRWLKFRPASEQPYLRKISMVDENQSGLSKQIVKCLHWMLVSGNHCCASEFIWLA